MCVGATKLIIPCNFYHIQFLFHCKVITAWFFRIQIHNELFIEILVQPFGTNSLQCRQEGFAQLPRVDNEYKNKLMRNKKKEKTHKIK